MKKYFKKDNKTHAENVRDIVTMLHDGKKFFTGNCIHHRYAIIVSDLYDTRNPNSEYGFDKHFMVDLYAGYLDTLERPKVIISYKPCDGHHRIGVCTTAKDLITAGRRAKKHKQTHFIDLHTGKLISSNG